MKNYLTKLAPYQVVVIMGYADLGKYLYDEVTATYPKKTVAVCDNALSQQGQPLKEGGVVLSPLQATVEYPAAVFIPTSVHRRNMMREQLIKLGVPAENILISEDIFEDEKLRSQNFRFLVKDSLTFGVDIARHCNLNCRGCTHYSSLAKKEFLDINTYHKDLVRLAEIFGERVNEILILGGEPLLNPNVGEYFKLSRKIFPKAKLTVITNGLLISDMPQSFWEICRSCDVYFRMSVYPVKSDYDAIFKKIRDEGAKVSPVVSSAESGNFYIFPFDFSGKQDAAKSFASCINANFCTTLKDGKIYPCPAVAFIDTFNNYFKTKMLPTEEDSIDIYKTDSADEILKFLAKPVPFCRFCDVSNRYDVEWARSKREITEWS